MPSSCGKRRSEDLDLEKKKQDNKIRVAVNLHHHAASTCESSSNIRLLVKDLKCLKKGTSTTKLINEIDRCAQRIIEVQSTTKKDICKVAPRGSTSYAYHRMSSEDFFESSPTKVVITRKKSVTILPKRTKKQPDPPAPMPVPCNYSSYTTSCRTQFLSKSGREKSRYIKQLISKGFMFSAKDTMDILSKFVKRKSKIINFWTKNKYIPIGRVQMYDLFKDHSNGMPITDWKTCGRKPILSCGEIIQISSGHREMEGRAITATDISKVLKEKRVSNDKEQGFSGKLSTSPCKQTCLNYETCFAAINRDLSLNNTVQQKTDSRYTAENSLISTMSFILAVAVTSYSVTVDPVYSVRKKIKEATEGAQVLEKLISDANNGASLIVVPPYLNTSTDDNTLFAFRGTAVNNVSFCLTNITKSSLSNFSKEIGGTDHKNGLRLRHTHTMNPYGNMAPIYATVTGLNERELSKELCLPGILIL